MKNYQWNYIVLFFLFLIATSLGAVTGMNSDLWTEELIYNTIFSFIVLSAIFAMMIGNVYKNQVKNKEKLK